MFLAAWKQDGFIKSNLSSYGAKFLQFFNARFFAYQLIYLCLFVGFFLCMRCEIISLLLFFLSSWSSIAAHHKNENGRRGKKKSSRLAGSADCFHWEWLFSCLLIPNYESGFITLHVYSKYQKWHFHDRIKPVKHLGTALVSFCSRTVQF